jgi:hypothetical protein
MRIDQSSVVALADVLDVESDEQRGLAHSDNPSILICFAESMENS